MEDDCNYCCCCCLKKVHNEEGKRSAWQCAAECGCCGKYSNGVDPDDIGMCSLVIRLICCYAPVRVAKFLKNCVPDCLWFTCQGCKLAKTTMSNDHLYDYRLDALNALDANSRNLSVESMTDLYSPTSQTLVPVSSINEGNSSSNNRDNNEPSAVCKNCSNCWRRFSLWRQLCNEEQLQQYASAIALGVSPNNAYQSLIPPATSCTNSTSSTAVTDDDDSLYVSIGSPIR